MGNKSETDPRRWPEDNVDASTGIPRLVADAGLPRYAHVPGRTPRPADEPCFGPISPADWQACRPYLLGIDLFNHGYYWEAHECWEAVWLAAGRRGRTADFLKGLIKLAAAFVKAREGRPIGVARHARRASELFQSVAVDPNMPVVMMGLSLHQLQQEAVRVANAAESVVDTSDSPVVRVTDFMMQLVENTSTQ